ncbi:hypothetical protein QA641_11195 [Bradyrhizobium sp. CB1650]|uniref:hypothetical protein n=1 Tax=Bradyrhizobium sp. CB1650 TaxID=3039153 RepID=UPI0024349F03|nr:hypothetical protein [Bradyrhizobium sp. CB1650]WGD54416.1 hypothetical protein QA641_11195 [Bradyrhizobium sp. CB1650]
MMPMFGLLRLFPRLAAEASAQEMRAKMFDTSGKTPARYHDGVGVSNAAPSLRGVMAGLVPAIHALTHGTKNVDARDKPGHDEFCGCADAIILPKGGEGTSPHVPPSFCRRDRSDRFASSDSIPALMK